MNESAREQYEVRINTLKPYLDQNEDPELARRASALLEGMREIAEQSADALAFEEALCASPLNTEYGIVYGELLAKNGSLSAREVAAATVQGIPKHGKTLARSAGESLVDTVSTFARVESTQAYIDATQDDYRAAKSAMRDIPGVGELEQVSNILTGLKGLFGKKK